MSGLACRIFRKAAIAKGAGLVSVILTISAELAAFVDLGEGLEHLLEQGWVFLGEVVFFVGIFGKIVEAGATAFFRFFQDFKISADEGLSIDVLVEAAVAEEEIVGARGDVSFYDGEEIDTIDGALFSFGK